ncbi:MAG: hypothetical protein KGV57_00375 [Fusobacterium sp.]|nr:hypothetical protein [Fusobacterium sp.]
MKIKICALLVISIMYSNNLFSETYTSRSDEVEIDLNKNILSAKDGISINNENISGLFHEIQRNSETEEIKFSNNALVNINQDTGNIKLETEKGNFFQKEKKGEFYNTFAYINVAKITGAEAPNDKIYFGSPYIKYENENIYAKDGWLTTDFNIVNFYNTPQKAGYLLKSKDITVEPDKQITLYDTNLFVNSKDITPFSFPWFRINIRRNSKVPLFPTFKSSTDYGFETMWGFLYGNKNDKFRGGFAPKFSDRMGLLVGRWENWYKFDKFGEIRLNIDDLLIYSKHKKNYKDTEKNSAEYEKLDKRYKVELSHKYSGEYGDLDFKTYNSTRSLVGNLNDVMTKYENNSVYKTLRKNGYDIDRYKFNKNIGFYDLNTNLKNKDTSFIGNMKLVSDKKAYGLLVYDSIKDDGTSYSKDHDLYSNFKFKKDNEKYKFSAEYKYLYDLDPGSTTKDSMSRNEEIKTNFEHKKTGFSADYQKRNGNNYRNLDFWESDLSSTLRQKNILGIDVNYVPKTVAKYKINNYENIKINLFDKKIKNYIFTPSLAYNFSEKKLDQVESEFRKSNLGSNRISEYNRFFNDIYNNKTEKRAGFKFFNENEVYNFAFGTNSEKLKTRKGLYDGTFKEYENSSNFYEILAKKQNISTNFGTFAFGAKIRQDNYKNSSDKTDTINLSANHKFNFNKNLANNFMVEYNKNLFSGNSENKERRLINKDDYIKIDDTINYENSKLVGEYKVSYKLANDSYDKKEKNNQYFSNDLKINFDENKNLKLNYSEDKRFANNIADEKNFNDLTYKNYGASYGHNKHEFSYKGKAIDFNLNNFQKNYDASEKMRQNKFGYSYKFENSKLNLAYAEGKNYVNTTNNKEIHRRNTEYSILYNIYGDVEHDFYASFKKYDYGHKKASNTRRNTDVYKLSYAYRDKRFEKEELMKYATLEYDKDQENITLKDIENIKTILDKKRSFRDTFELTRIEDESFRIGNYKKTFKTYLTLEKNNARYSQTGNLKDSLSKLEGGLNYSYNRVGVGYNFKEKSSWKKDEWKKRSREHELSVFAKVGKPSQGWKIKSYAKLYDNIEDTSNNNKRKRALDGLGIEIGKEMGYYEWAVSYENKYNSSNRDYEWRAGLHFTLLTFPNNSIFGGGAESKRRGNKNKMVARPDGYLLDRPHLLDKKNF